MKFNCDESVRKIGCVCGAIALGLAVMVGAALLGLILVVI